MALKLSVPIVGGMHRNVRYLWRNLGGDTKEELERLAIRTIAKQMAKGDYTCIAPIEECIREGNRAWEIV